VWHEIEKDAKRFVDGEDVVPELPSGFDNLPSSERDALLGALQLSEELHASMEAEKKGMAALVRQAKGVIKRAQELEPGIGDNATLEEAIAALKRHGVNPGLSPELEDMVVRVPTGESDAMSEERTVPAFYPNFADADKVRSWDGSEQAEAWAKMMSFRDECIAASVGDLAGMDFEDMDYPGLIAFLWNLDEEEAAEIVRRRQGR
jgi:hypothetical protein